MYGNVKKTVALDETSLSCPPQDPMFLDSRPCFVIFRAPVENTQSTHYYIGSVNSVE